MGVNPQNGLPQSVLQLPQFNVLKYGFDTQGANVNAAPWAALMNDLKAQAHPRGARIVFPAGDFVLTNLTLDTTDITLNGNLIIEGQGDATRILPGGSQGRALTIVGGAGNLKPIVRDFRLGYGAELAAVDLPYSQPILELQSASGFRLSGITSSMKGTGTVIRLNNSFDGEIDFQWFEMGQYAVPLVVDKAANQANQMDTIKLKGLIIGDSGPVINAALNNLEADQLKVVKSSASTAAEGTVANAANAADGTITLQAGQGASFAVGDAIAIDFGDTGAAGSVHYLEANKVTGISTDTLTLAQPLQYAHNGTTSHIPVYRGGIGLAGGNFTDWRVHDSHFEGHDCAIQVGQGAGLELDNNSHQCNRYVRAIALLGQITDINVGPLIAGGAPPGAATSNIIVDMPSWTTQAFSRIGIDGPLIGIGAASPTVNYKGTSSTIDARGWYTLTSLTFPTTIGAGWNVFGAKLSRHGLLLRGFQRSTAAVAAAAVIATLPTHLIPANSAVMLVYATAANPLTTTPSINSLWVHGASDANPGQLTLEVATTAAGNLTLEGLGPIAVA